MADQTVFNAEFYQKLNTMRLTIKMKLAAGQNGGRKSNAKGSSVEFSDFREYILGDDIRRIDWNAYGRFDKLFVKLFMEEKEGNFHIFIDGSKSMDFGEKSKSTCALRVAAALSYVVLDNLDRLHMNVIRDKSVERNKSVTGKQAFAKTINQLENVTFESGSDILAALNTYKFSGRGVSIVISDFYTNDLEEILKCLSFRKQEIILIQVLSREEVNPKFDGTVKLMDSELPSSVRVTMSGNLQKEYKKSYDKFVHRIDSLCKKYAASYIPIVSDESLDSIMFGSLSKVGNRI